MQVRRYGHWHQRALYYLARMLSQQLAQGEDYSQLRAAVGIHLLDFDLFSATAEQRHQAHWRFEMRDQAQPAVGLGNLLQLIAHNQFDTVYHEHVSYLSLHAAQRILQAQDLRLWDVEQLPTHGGSLRIYAIHADDPRPAQAAVAELLATEQTQGLLDLATYQAFQPRADRIKYDLLAYLIEQQRAGRRIAAYGGAAKGNTLLNDAGIKPDLLPYVCDAAQAKQGRYLPGSHIPIRRASGPARRAPG